MTGAAFTERGLAQWRDRMAGHVASGSLPGLIALVARAGETHVEVIGTKAVGDSRPMGRDAIFRIASLSKPIAAAAALTLVEDGTLRLDDAVDAWLPELADRRVLTSLPADLDDTVPAIRPITLDDLLTFRLGFGCILARPGTYPIQVAEEQLQLATLGPPWPPTPITPDQWMQRLGTLPLMHQPGERWLYNTGAQVLGVLVERAAGQPLEAVLRERIFEPLAMPDTAFSVPPEQLHRLTTAYAPDPATDALGLLDAAEGSWWSRPPAMPNAAGWLVSTVDDYWTFVQMLLAGGAHPGGRILSEASVQAMTTDHLTPEQRADAALFLGDQSGWGLGLAVPATGVAATGRPRGFGWDGGTGTTWRSDAEAGLTGILFTQRAMTSPRGPKIFADFWDAAYEAIDP